MRVRLPALYDFALEDCLYHPTCENCFYRRVGKHRESEDISPRKLCLQKIAFELWLGFENLEMSEGCSNMNASSFITFFTYMLRQNG